MPTVAAEDIAVIGHAGIDVQTAAGLQKIANRRREAIGVSVLARIRVRMGRV